MISSMPDFLAGLVIGVLLGIGCMGAALAWFLNRP